MENNIITFEIVNAMTRTELIEVLTGEPFNMDLRECNGMTHSRMVGTYWKAIAPKTEPVVQVPVNSATGVPLKVKVPVDKSKECACGCLGRTKGGTWLPGHDAKHNAKKTVNGFRKNGPKPCLCGCGEWTKGGTFRPGHDAKYYSALHASAKIGVKPEFLPPTLNPEEIALIAIDREKLIAVMEPDESAAA